MTKTKTYKYGPHTFKSYCKAVGQGWEVGFTYKNKNYFISNFVHKTEATQWWSFFNKEITSFSNKFTASADMPFAWYCNFLSNHLYTCYYSWLDKVFNKHETTFKKAYTQDFKKYMKIKKASHKEDTHYHLRAA